MHYTEEKDLLLCYITDIFGHYDYGKDMFLSAAGYRKDGKVIDHMFDSYIFLSQPNYLYTYFEGGGYELKAFTKADWLNYITNEEFAPDTALAALEAAVGEVKDAIGDPIEH